MKPRLIILGAVLMIVLSFIIVYNSNVKHTLKEEIAYRNLENIKKIQIGMDTTEVLNIMGSPMEKRNYNSELFYDYETPSGTSIQCQIIFDSSGQVVFISPSFENLN